MQRLLKAVPILLVSLITGCAGLTNSTSFREMSSAYRDVLEQYSNDNILLNVVRSSQSMPVSFLDMPSVMGSGAVSSNLQVGPSIYGVAPGSSLAGFFTPTAGSGITAGVTLGVNNSFNFTQSSLDNSSFMVSFLSDMKPAVIASLSNSQLATRDVLYSLAIESVEVQDLKGKSLMKVVNDPYTPQFTDFQKTLFNLVRAGITVEQVEKMMPISAPMDAEAVNRNLQGIATATAVPMTGLMPVKLPGGRDGFQVMRMMQPEARICLQEKAADDALSFRVSNAAYCKSSAAASAPNVGNKQEVTLIIKLRSVRNVFEFLGALVNIQNGPDARMVKIVDSARITPTTSMSDILASAKPLFVVKKGAESGNALMSVKYQGVNYYVPKESDDSSYTNQVLVLLSQMLTLTKVPGSIPLSPAVLIK
jgi:hypothetical protein